MNITNRQFEKISQWYDSLGLLCIYASVKSCLLVQKKIFIHRKKRIISRFHLI